MSADTRVADAGLAACADAPANHYDLALLDLDGVVYIGPHAVRGASEALADARARGLRLAFVTNNASRTPETVAEQLTGLGVPTDPEDVVTSAQAAASLLAERLPAGAAVLVVGGDGLHAALRAVGLRPVTGMDAEPVAVVQGFSPDVGWRMLAEGTRAVRAGLPWVATNTDLTVPTAFGPAPGNGTLVAAVRAASGVEPEVAGKPRPPLFQAAVRRYGSRRPLVVGDRLDTDLEGAVAAGFDGLLVLTGVTGAADAIAAAPLRRPRLIGADLGALLVPHPSVDVRSEGDGSAIRGSCAAAEVRVDAAGAVVVRAGEDPVDLLRAACAASWDWVDRAAAAGRPARAVESGEIINGLRRLRPDLDWAR